MNPMEMKLLEEAVKKLAGGIDSIGMSADYEPTEDEESPEDFVDSIMGEPDSDFTERSVLDNLQGVLSDVNMKDVDEETGKAYIKGLVKHKKKLKPTDVKVMLKSFKKEGDGWDDDILNKYADNIKNYAYNYKEEAKKLDPNIDPSIKHIGPMAQDIEEVNPACIITDKTTGYKSVDTGRLALMNAGAIAELARELKEVKHGSTT